MKPGNFGKAAEEFLKKGNLLERPFKFVERSPLSEGEAPDTFLQDSVVLSQTLSPYL